MPTNLNCLPWWHSLGLIKGKISSGCQTINGNVNCAPEALREKAEAYLQTFYTKYWPRGKRLPLEAYTLARYMTSEVGNGSPEDRVAVGEVAVNRAKLWKQEINDVLLYRQKPGHTNRGYYGPIHGPSGVKTAPYGRWAATSKDPNVADVLLADLILTGQTNNFAQGADDQDGIEYFDDPTVKIRSAANDGDYWIGPLPGVDHWRTFLQRHFGYSQNDPRGFILLQRGLQSVQSKARTDWSQLPVCSRKPLDVSRPQVIVGAIGLISLAVGYALGRSQILDILDA